MPIAPNFPREVARKGKEANLCTFHKETRGQWPFRLASDRAMKMASDMKPATTTTLVFMCILPLTVNQAATEAMPAS